MLPTIDDLILRLCQQNLMNCLDPGNQRFTKRFSHTFTIMWDTFSVRIVERIPAVTTSSMVRCCGLRQNW